MNVERRVEKVLFVVFTAVSLLFLSLPTARSLQVFKLFLAYCFDPGPQLSAKAAEVLKATPSNYLRLMTVDQTNRELRLDATAHRLKLQQADALLEENRALRHVLGLREQGLWKFKIAGVLERDASDWFGSLVVDLGQEAAISLNAPVLGEQDGEIGVVGRILELGPKTARVLLIDDQLSSIAVMVGDSRREGLLTGQGRRLLRVDFLDPEAAIAVGDRVLTSPTSAVFAPGNLVGAVRRVLPVDPYLPYQSVEVAAAMDINNLKQVLIIEGK
ncbi:MAG: hypothetical protein A3G41_04520 [Elusimicrobia bacterium RIFCSPLOWO2_12_FULL_59_9]|nr:MAG: hypothetical protein A3G41_04520 [Elusimicrobia bacterium RIFCSPLOWO2_12_FULL_59_9]